MNDTDVIDAFVEHLKRLGHPDIEITSRPGEDNRATEDIDAIAGQFAIEHTSVDSIPYQRRNENWYQVVVGGLEEEFKGRLDYRLQINIDCDAIGPGQDWSSIRENLKILDFRAIVIAS